MMGFEFITVFGVLMLFALSETDRDEEQGIEQLIESGELNRTK